MAYSKPKTLAKSAKKSSFAILLFCVILFVWCENAAAVSVLMTASNTNSKAEEYKRKCKNVIYEDVARDPEQYKEQDITFIGKVRYVEEDGSLEAFLLEQDDPDKLFSGDNWIASYFRKQSEDRIIEGDHIRVYGKCSGLISYENVFGATKSAPGILIRHYERLK